VKDTIDRNGESVSADEVETHVRAHPKIALCAAIGLSDADRGEQICAVVIPAGGADAPTSAQLRAFLIERGVAAFKLPDRVAVVTEFPLTAIGKIDKRASVDALSESATR
jgi:non-ribosomal peptide synthetase component E (peptide arylation enzyme)